VTDFVNDLSTGIAIAKVALPPIKKAIAYLSKPKQDRPSDVTGIPVTIRVQGRDSVDNASNIQFIEGIIWTLDITNNGSLGVMGEKCAWKAYWGFIEAEVDMFWVNHKAIPTNCTIITNTAPPMNSPILKSVNPYSYLLGTFYVAELLTTGINYTTIPKRKTKSLYLLLTLRDHDYAYLITKVPSSWYWDDDSHILVEHFAGKPLYLKKGQQEEISIRMILDEINVGTFHNYILKFNNWENVDFKEQ